MKRFAMLSAVLLGLTCTTATLAQGAGGGEAKERAPDMRHALLRGIRYRCIQPRRPDQNGKVERNHRTDAEGFWDRDTSDFFEAAAAALPECETRLQGGALLDGAQGLDPGGEARCRPRGGVTLNAPEHSRFRAR